MSSSTLGKLLFVSPAVMGGCGTRVTHDDRPPPMTTSGLTAGQRDPVARAIRADGTHLLEPGRRGGTSPAGRGMPAGGIDPGRQTDARRWVQAGPGRGGSLLSPPPLCQL